MKKLLLLLSVAGIYFGFSNKPALKTDFPPIRARESRSLPQRRPSREGNVPRTEERQKISAQEIQICLDSWRDLREWDPSSDEFPPKDDCERVPTALSVYRETFLSQCKGESVTPMCLSAHRMYRAQTTFWLTRNLPSNEIYDPEILKDRILAELGTQPDKAVKDAERLVELDPESEAAARTLQSIVSIQETLRSGRKAPLRIELAL